MTAPVSRAVMALACRCLGESRREWALAMRAEFDVALAEGRAFGFATGCLAAAWREMPSFPEGRLVLGNYGLALGMLIPMAVLHFALVLGFSSVLAGGEPFQGVLLGRVSENPMVAWSQVTAAPCLLALWLLLGIGHLRLAWVVADSDWARVVKVGAFIGATQMTLFLLTASLALEVTFLVLHAAALAIELAAVVSAARRHARVFALGAMEMRAS